MAESFALDIKDNLKDLTKGLTRLQRKSVPIATAKALTFTAERAQKRLTQLIPQVFSNPTNFTRKSIRKTSAKVSRLTAEVFIKDISFTRAHYLLPNIDGGLRPQKRAEQRLGGYWVPGKDAKRNGFGNLTRGVWSKILADVGRFGQHTGDAANTLTKAQGGKKNILYFMRRHSSGRRIIYKKIGKKRIIPWLVEILRRPRYRRRLPFEKVVRVTTAKQFDTLFTKQLARELKKLGFNARVLSSF